ncbi:hypothetical protein E1A91_D11G082300v1 [Gossypium mustelinum]|uniref:Uncharacterized protein n=3 Tax=Gossypium TaxID=3633 RepID=A0A5J5P809_GOSBA|nr:hypothetical protein ES319_D11G080200v1 [Gossypium barbadense]TYG44246.1 hypothetical protein ES288_D11G082600v1 [Gossypium darwinii]TYI54545.1 hypothetical protein E1A91_D11G082300v1 [Gossypium mustelinum]
MRRSSTSSLLFQTLPSAVQVLSHFRLESDESGTPSDDPQRYMRVWELLRRGVCTALEVAETWDVVAREERGQLRHRAMVASRLSAG